MALERGWRFVGLLALCALLSDCTTAKPDAEIEPQVVLRPVAIPSDLQPAVSNAEVWGRALYDSYAAPAGENSKAVATALETVRESVKDSCVAGYRAVAVSTPEAPTDRIVVYYIGELPKAEGLVIGRHYRIETTADGRGVLLGEPSSSRCIVLPPLPAGETAARQITYNLALSPNEFHVFLTLLDGHALEIVTSAGRWRVADGRITYLGRI